MSDDKPTELYRKHRPTKLSDIVGNKAVIAALTKAVKQKNVPHAIMMTGSSGCGKTTVARILRDRLNCNDKHYTEINASEKRGIEMVRRIGETIGARPMFGDARVYVIDEAQGLTPAAQNALLKHLEDPPAWSYLILCTTDPAKIIKTIHTRCTQYKMETPDNSVLSGLLKQVCGGEKVKVPSAKVLNRICDVSENLPRKALVLLEQVYKLDSEAEMLETLQKTETKQKAIDLVRKLVQPKPQWKVIKEMVKEMDDDPEATRRIMLGYASSICLGGGPLAKRAGILYDAFRDLFVNGKPDLVFACYIVCAGN